MKHHRLFTDNLEVIQNVVRIIGRRHRLSNEDQEDFAGYVHLELLKDDCAALRKFQNRSSWETFLAAVIGNLALDFLVQRWGRWRPAAVSQKLGPIAMSLDRLVNRDGHTLEEAIEIVRAKEGARITYADLHALWEQLPARQQPAEVSEDAAVELSSSETAESHIADSALQEDIKRVEGALHAAFRALAAQDRVMIVLRYVHELPAAEVARVMKISVPTIHRRLDRSLKEMRESLFRAGVDSREVSGLIGNPTAAMSRVLRAHVERFLKPVRLSKRDG